MAASGVIVESGRKDGNIWVRYGVKGITFIIFKIVEIVWSMILDWVWAFPCGAGYFALTAPDCHTEPAVARYPLPSLTRGQRQ